MIVYPLAAEVDALYFLVCFNLVRRALADDLPVVEDGDVVGLSEVLIRALTQPEMSADMGLRGRARALEMFTWHRVAERALVELQQLIDVPAGSDPTR